MNSKILCAVNCAVEVLGCIGGLQQEYSSVARACLNNRRSVAGGPTLQTAAIRPPDGAGSILTYFAHLQRNPIVS